MVLIGAKYKRVGNIKKMTLAFDLVCFRKSEVEQIADFRYKSGELVSKIFDHVCNQIHKLQVPDFLTNSYNYQSFELTWIDLRRLPSHANSEENFQVLSTAWWLICQCLSTSYLLRKAGAGASRALVHDAFRLLRSLLCLPTRTSVEYCINSTHLGFGYPCFSPGVWFFQCRRYSISLPLFKGIPSRTVNQTPVRTEHEYTEESHFPRVGVWLPYRV